MSYPETIKAIILSGPGDFDVINETNLPFPKPGKNEILIKVAYTGINFADNHLRAGVYPIMFPHGVGGEGSGIILELPSDPSVVDDEEYKKRGFKIGSRVSIATEPTAREYLAADWTKVFVIPENVSLEQASAAYGQGATAVTFIKEAYDVKAGDTILIHTVAGGFGLLLTQLVKLRGATVIGTTSTKEKAEVAKKYGADHVILYKEEDMVKRVLEITKGEGVEGIFDGVGKDTFEIDFKVIKRKGTIVFVGSASGFIPSISPLQLIAKNIKVLRPTLFNYIYTPSEFRTYFTELFDLIASQNLRILISKVYPFSAEGVRQAEKDLTGGKSVGKLLVKVSDL